MIKVVSFNKITGSNSWKINSRTSYKTLDKINIFITCATCHKDKRSKGHSVPGLLDDHVNLRQDSLRLSCALFSLICLLSSFICFPFYIFIYFSLLECGILIFICVVHFCIPSPGNSIWDVIYTQISEFIKIK